MRNRYSDERLQEIMDRTVAAHNNLMCESCGELAKDLQCAGQFIQGGDYHNCWVCSQRCRQELFAPSLYSDGDDRHLRCDQ